MRVAKRVDLAKATRVMSKSFSFRARERDAGNRLDAVLAGHGSYTSRSAAAKACESGQVLVNGKSAPKKQLIGAGDFIYYEVEEKLQRVVSGQDIPLDIRFEDNDVLVLSKQAGLVCHPSLDHPNGTLVNALINHCGYDHLCNVQGDDDRLGIVHRLDMDTTGLMLAAKTNDAGQALMESISARSVDRHYLALVHGRIAHDTAMIDAPIARHATERLRMAIRDTESARDALTTFQVLERFEADKHDDGYTLIDCKLFTGRTHQIRVHLEYACHPLVGDPLYTAHAPRHKQAACGIKRQFLHSFHVGFEHPVSHEFLEFNDALPADLHAVLTALQKRSTGRTQAGNELFERLQHAPVPCLSAYQG